MGAVVRRARTVTATATPTSSVLVPTCRARPRRGATSHGPAKGPPTKRRAQSACSETVFAYHVSNPRTLRAPSAKKPRQAPTPTIGSVAAAIVAVTPTAIHAARGRRPNQ